MAKSILLDVLEKTIGKYVLNLDPNSLNVAVWSGKIELSSLQLNTKAVNMELASMQPPVPFRVRSGHFHSFQIDVPWTNLMHRPVVCRANGLTVEIEPYQQNDMPQHTQKGVDATKIIQARKEAIEHADEYRVQARALRKLTDEAANDSSAGSSSYSSKLVRRILENMQIEISNVYLSLESDDSSAGVCLESLQLVTTDEQGRKSFVDRSSSKESFLYKSLLINGLGIYLDEKQEGTNTKSHGALTSINEGGSDDEDGTDTDTLDHTYVLAPLSFTAKLRQADSNVCLEHPKYLLSSELSSLSILLSKSQVELAGKINAKMTPPRDDGAKLLFPEYRPLERLGSGDKTAAKKWWKYAFRSVGRLNGYRSWLEFHDAFKKRKEYISLYKRKKHAPKPDSKKSKATEKEEDVVCHWIKPLSPEEDKILESLEKDRSISVEGIMFWRDMADSQAEREIEKYTASNAEKAASKSYFSSIFGSSSPSKKKAVGEEPPITLSPEELRELEAATIEQAEDDLMSKESKLYDIQFVLNSFRILLTTHHYTTLAQSKMGTVSTSFQAKADGSYDFDFSLASLVVEDKITTNSLFPNVLKNQLGESEKAFSIEAKKNKNGDQKLQVWLTTFEAVASPTLLKELQQFATVQQDSQQTGSMKNPVLTQSLSGSVDLFYDASEGPASVSLAQPSIISTGPVVSPQHKKSESPTAVDNLSNALFDAWKARMDTRSSWTMDLDISAPILVVPESCTNPRSHVLIFDLGHFKMVYGSKMPGSFKTIKQWFKDNPKVSTTNVHEPTLDYGNLEITSLTFMISEASQWKRWVKKHSSLDSGEEKLAVIEPISIHLKLGVEVASNSRICARMVLPSIIFGLSPEQLANMISVYNSWTKLLQDLSPLENKAEDDSSVSNFSVSTAGSRLIEQALKSVIVDEPTDGSGESGSLHYKKFHADVQLQRLSVNVSTDEGHGMEAHLVNVESTLDVMNDAVSRGRLTMGWFWIQDNLHNDFARVERLVMHSRLPEIENASNAMQELENMGVFMPDYQRSSDLADVKFLYSPSSHIGEIDPFLQTSLKRNNLAANVLVDASFSSLFVNWNPKAIGLIVHEMSRFTNYLDETFHSKEHATLLVPPSDPNQFMDEMSLKDEGEKAVKKAKLLFCLVARAQMEGVQICLRSARDDLDIFTLIASTANASYVTKVEEGNIMNASLGNLSITTPDMGETLHQFHSLLGLSPGRSDSLLSVCYVEGGGAMAAIDNDDLRKSFRKTESSELGAWGLVNISPMKMVYIQSQVLALVEYANEGILGVLAGQAASSAAVAAVEMAASAASRKEFVIRATGFEIVLPEAASEKNHFSMKTGELVAEYTALPYPNSASAKVVLSDVMLADFNGVEMQDEPIGMSLDVVIPPEGVGSNEDQAYDIKVHMSNAAFLLMKHQYHQLLSTLDRNIGELNLFLRDYEFTQQASIDQGVDTPDILTHAGVEFEVKPRNTNIEVSIQSLSLDLLEKDENDSIARVQAVHTRIFLKSDPHIDKTSAYVSLKELVCTDERFVAVGRFERSLISQDKSQDLDQNFFEVTYEKTGQTKTDIALRVGTPRMVLIPDVLLDIMNFVQSQDPERATQKVVSDTDKPPTIDVQPVDQGDGFEVTQTHPTDRNILSFSLQTGPCSVVLVDLGGRSLVGEAGVTSSVRKGSSLAETIVLRGIFDAKSSLISRISTSSVVDADIEMNGDAVEVYTAFGKDISALQVVDPFQFSIHGRGRGLDDLDQNADLRVAIITPIDVCFSMRNYALMNAILGSLAESFESKSETSQSIQPLSVEDAQRIEHLDHELEAEAEDHQSLASFSTDSIHSSQHSQAQKYATKRRLKFSFKLTLPDARVTMVNDLQGLDDALLRLEFQNLVANVQIRDGEQTKPGTEPFTGFDASMNCSILADYFDASESKWRVLLMKPWELTLRTARGQNRKVVSNRPNTSLDIESFPCHISFSEEFLMSLAGAAQMWSVYSAATVRLTEAVDASPSTSQSPVMRRSIAATAARTLVTALPYAIENNSGADFQFKVIGSGTDLKACKNGTIEYFRFPPPRSKGMGGKRLYGQDVTFDKAVSIRVGLNWIELSNVDQELNHRKQCHVVEESLILFSEVKKEGKTTVIRLSSGIDVHCKSPIPFSVSVPSSEGLMTLAVSSKPISAVNMSSKVSVQSDGTFSKESSKLGIPADLLRVHREEWQKQGKSTLFLSLSPELSADHTLRGDIVFAINVNALSTEERLLWRGDVICRPVNHTMQGELMRADSFVLRARIFGQIIDRQYTTLDIFLEPRATIKNFLPIPLSIKTPMPHTYSKNCREMESNTFHDLGPGDEMEVYTVGHSIAISAKCSELPVGGTPSGESDWIDLPLTREFQMPEPLRSSFPFTSYSGANYDLVGGTEFFVADGMPMLAELVPWAEGNKSGNSIGNSVEMIDPSDGRAQRVFYLAVCNYAVDHTGEVLFAQFNDNSNFRRSLRRRGQGISTNGAEQAPLGAYKSNRNHGRVTLLPSANETVQLIHLTMDAEYGMQRSKPFRIEEVSISDGGVNSTPILWEDGRPSGFFAYQKLINANQAEIHVVPEIVVYNGSTRYFVHVRQPNGADVVIEPGKIAPLRRNAQQAGVISLEWVDFDGRTSPLQIDKLGLRVAIVRRSDTTAIGSVAMQTVVGAEDSRLVVKLGEIRLGAAARRELHPDSAASMFADDFMRCRIQWSELRVTLNEARPVVEKNRALLENALDRIVTEQDVGPPGSGTNRTETWMQAREARTAEEKDRGSNPRRDAVTSLILKQFTVDWQRVFKEDTKQAATQSEKERLQSLERSQLSVIIHNIRITDETKGSKIPAVLDSTSNTSFFDMCIRFKGPMDSELVKVDLFDLNLAHSKGASQRIVLSTTESFAWKLLDLGDRILAAAGEFHGVNLELTWDDESKGYIVEVREGNSSSFIESDASRYTPPNSEQLYDVARARVSPFVLLLSFERAQGKTKNADANVGQYKALLTYFTQRMKFKIDRAELKFAKYEARDIRGPADRILEIISTVYMSRMKLQFVSLITAMSFQDWKILSNRSSGEDDFQDGDVLRAAGNVAGNTVNYLLKGSGRGIESAFKRGSSGIGDTIESAAGKVGAKGFGTSVNSVVSGVGGGLGQAVGGVGTGAGKVFKGAGQGVGQVFGGVTGGVSSMAKGVHQSISQRDGGRAMAQGMASGVTSVGSGVGQGVTSVVAGTADGVLSVGKGLFSGVKSVGKGVVGAVRMKKQAERRKNGQ